METKQTAVDFLLKQISARIDIIKPNAIEVALLQDVYYKAKAMEKEQMIEFADEVLYNAECSFTGSAYLEKDINEIYNETYGK